MIDKVIRKLRLLIRHEQSARKIGSTEEADAFAGKIQNLCEVHRVELADVAIDERPMDPIIQRELTHKQEQTTRWVQVLINGICHGHYCLLLEVTPSEDLLYYALEGERPKVKKGSELKFKIVGKESDVEVATYMSVTLIRTARDLAKAAHKAFKILGLPVDNFYDSFFAAFAATLSKRYVKRRKEYEQKHNANTTALVKTSASAIRKYVEGEFGQTTNMPINENQSRFNAAAVAAGRAAANEVDLNANSLTGANEKQTKEIASDHNSARVARKVQGA